MARVVSGGPPGTPGGGSRRVRRGACLRRNGAADGRPRSAGDRGRGVSPRWDVPAADPPQLDLPTLAVGVITIALIIAFERIGIRALGLVIAVVATSAAAVIIGLEVATLNDLGVVASSLLRPEVPLLELVPALIIPAASLAFVGLVQGASISANFPNPDGRYPDFSRDFVGQGAANVASGNLQGMPVGGSASASALNKAAWARSRQSLVIAGIVMAVVVVFGQVVGNVAMPALAGLLMLVGYRTIKPAGPRSHAARRDRRLATLRRDPATPGPQ